MLRPNKNIKIFLNYFAGPVLFIWLSVSIYHQVRNQPHLKLSWLNIRSALSGEQNWMFWVVLLLMLLNWGVEARKWQVILKPVERISWWRAFKAVLAGVALAVNTPNRIGEYGGRIIFVHEDNRIKAISLTLMASLSQVLITLVAGCGGLLYLLNYNAPATSLLASASYVFWIRVVFYVVAVISFLGLLVYFRLSWLVRWLDRVPAFSKIAYHIAVLEDCSTAILLRVLNLSLTRYAIFALQYLLLIQLMQVDVSLWQGFWIVSVIFLVMAIIPTIALAEIGLRGKVSLELFGLFSNNHVGILTVSLGIWAINLIIPAVIGSLFILRIKIFNSK